jgi:hypothetical protein
MANGHGGKRAGAGRKKGGTSAQSRARREETLRLINEEGVTPLQVMLEAMRQQYEAGKLVAAAEIAKFAAPYVHPRLSALTHNNKVGVQLEIVEEIIIAGSLDQNNPASPSPTALPPVERGADSQLAGKRESSNGVAVRWPTSDETGMRDNRSEDSAG